MKIYQRSAGFTLIELLVVIAIIGLLSSVVLTSLNTARQKGRDARRVADVQQIQLALEFYADANPTVGYPAALTSLAPTYIGAVPTDPRSGASYAYAIRAVGGVNVHYCVGALMEAAAPSPADTCDNTATGLNGSDPQGASTGFFPYNTGP